MYLRHICFSSLLFTLLVGGCQCDDDTQNNASDTGVITLDASGGDDAGGDADDVDMGEGPGPCATNPCVEEGRGVCVELESAYSCSCDAGLQEREGECVADPCAADPCADVPNAVCDEGEPDLCACAPGFHEEGGVCVSDDSCVDDPCGGRGVCDDTGGTISCACREGFAGGFCESCDVAAGFQPDGDGGCTDDPCDVLVCSGGKECQVTDGAAVCFCPAGTHEEGGACVIDQDCQPNTCSNRGTCDDSDGLTRCACDEGYAGESCGECDDAGGFHDDLMGGCTNDPCLPNPCSELNRTSCTSGAVGAPAVCGCDVGFHDSASGSCVPDESCEAGSCSGNGVCDDSTNEIECACSPGYVGDVCDACDVLGGYRDDMMGGCTNDPCLPNPCTEPNKDACTSGGPGTQPMCGCAAGFHPDGAGGCTDDPCLPDLCAAQNQACRVESGQAVCYVPDCDDFNPCTDDTLSQGSCVYTDVTDGTSCRFDACNTGGTCQTGQCQGTSAPDCDDSNPCTDDVCDVAQGGCVSTDDDSNVPDDGVGCTADSCSGGVATHAPDDGACDDSLYCTGLEVCAPGSNDADAQGCVATDVPQAPADPGPCQSYGACDEATSSFPLVNASPGDSCDDGIACTSGDVCGASGSCVGTITQACHTTPTDCTSTTLWSSDVEVPVAHLTSVDVTYGGQDLLTATPRGSAYVYAMDSATGAYHRLLYYYYGGSGTPTLRKSVGVPPGVYDIVFTTDPDELNDPSQLFFQSDANYVINGFSILQADVVFAAGANAFAVDVPVAELTSIDVTYDGQDLLTATPRGSAYVYAKEKETDAYHRLLYYYYGGSGTPTLRKSVGVPPGVYDIVFTTDPDELNDPSQLFFQSDANYVINGFSILQADVVFAAGANAFAVDVPVAELTSIDVTYDGQDLLTATPRGSAYVYAMDSATGAYHRLLYYYYGGSGTPTLRKSVGVPPGVYDIVFTTDPDELNDPSQLFFQSDANYVINGFSILQTDVVFSSGANAFSADIPVAELTSIDVTYDGQDLLTATPRGSAYVYAKEKETDAYHRLLYYYYGGSGTPTLRKSVGVPPGTYDIVFTTDPDELNDPSQLFFQSDANYVINGFSVLQADVVFSSGANAFAVDVPVAELTSIDVTYDGQDLLTATPRGSAYVYAKEKETDAYHRLLYYYYGGSGTPTLRKSVGVPPGVYDIVFTTDPDELNDPSQLFFQSDANYVINGFSVLQADVVFSSGVNAFSVDVPVAHIASIDMTYDGQDLLTATPRGSAYVYAMDRVTKAYHRLLYYYYGGSGTPTLRKSVGVPPGVYDIVFTTDPDELNDPSQLFFQSDANYVINGFSVLNYCVEFP